MIKPLDIVKTPNNSIGIVKEINPASEDYPDNTYSLVFIRNMRHPKDYNAWWKEKELTYLDNIAAILAGTMAHPFGQNQKANMSFYTDKGLL